MPSASWVLGIWVLGGIASVTGALVFADLGARWPRAGGLYVFLREGFGGKLGSALSFLYGFLQLLVARSRWWPAPWFGSGGNARDRPIHSMKPP